MRTLAVLLLVLTWIMSGVGSSVAAPPEGGAVAPSAEAEAQPVKIYLFWQQGCPYCAAARQDLNGLVQEVPDVTLVPLELDRSEETDTLYIRAVGFFGLAQAAVPLVVVGDRAFLGYFDRDRSARLYREAAAQCRSRACPDIIGDLQRAVTDEAAAPAPAAGPASLDSDARRLVPEVIELPWVGPVSTANLSLPALTVLLAAIDGFNPCAMWVLVFLIGLLIGLKDEWRMWALGGAFLFATAAMYFAVMVAWLNLVLFIGAVSWVRAIIGVLALAGGLFYLREYWANPAGSCRITDASRRQRLMAGFRAAVEKRQLALAAIGVMTLAVMVNFIELLCSAGIPAVFTQILALSDLSRPAYYGYVSLYILIFMLDDIAIFVTAMVALKVTGLTGAYARVSHLIGGIVLLVIGALMLLRPELLSFS